MNTDDLLCRLSDRSVELYLDGDVLRFRAPQGALTPEFRGAIAAHRPAIIERLRRAEMPHGTGKPCMTCERRNWRDGPPQEGRTRTTCGKCGRFIGYRPADPQMT